MTDLSKIKEEFITLSSLSEEDAGKYQSLIEMECEYINSLLKSSDDENNSCVIFLCAAKAYYRYMLTNQSDGITSFKAGDVSYSLDTSSALENARATKGVPTCIVMKTIKGKGVSYMENAVGWHGKAPNTEEYEQAMTELKAALAELEA